MGPGYPEEAAPAAAAAAEEEEEDAEAAVALALGVEVEKDRELAGLEPITPFGLTPLKLLPLPLSPGKVGLRALLRAEEVEVLVVVTARPPSAFASYLGVTSPPSPGIIGGFKEVVDALVAPKGNLLSKLLFEAEADEVAGRLPPVANEPQLL